MSAADFVYLTMGIALVVYVLSAGADFGAGVWDLFLGAEHRKLGAMPIVGRIP